MEITHEMLELAVSGKPLTTAWPFDSCDDDAIAGFYKAMFAELERNGFHVAMELDHYGSGYASYISALLYRRASNDVVEYQNHVEITGVLIYLSRLAPIAVFGASSLTKNKDNRGSASGFITAENLNHLPSGDWSFALGKLQQTLEKHGIELLQTRDLLQDAPAGIRIPTIFDGPYCVFDALFYWAD